MKKGKKLPQKTKLKTPEMSLKQNGCALFLYTLLKNKEQASTRNTGEEEKSFLPNLLAEE